eukprot:CAMPEP_0175159170 /NCGR_PEP_ID=MMETSP0087-20121206/23254_1 /TAXON_ID=136419 /ORGANISM="Unknown Unknown, Strain D1" /LENGTH=88 /DNA_ID=CAMNT_0016447151 /DNA_START=171 /DNA_END=437 /DNA_ORIENTATION=+
MDTLFFSPSTTTSMYGVSATFHLRVFQRRRPRLSPQFRRQSDICWDRQAADTIAITCIAITNGSVASQECSFARSFGTHLLSRLCLYV